MFNRPVRLYEPSRLNFHGNEIPREIPRATVISMESRITVSYPGNTVKLRSLIPSVSMLSIRSRPRFWDRRLRQVKIREPREGKKETEGNWRTKRAAARNRWIAICKLVTRRFETSFAGTRRDFAIPKYQRKSAPGSFVSNSVHARALRPSLLLSSLSRAAVPSKWKLEISAR